MSPQRYTRTGRKLTADERLAKRRNLPMPKEVNKRKCPTCGAEAGKTCIKLTAKRFLELPKTHDTYRRERVEESRKNKQTQPQHLPMVLDPTL